MKLRLICKEGFSYVSWQRVYVYQMIHEAVKINRSWKITTRLNKGSESEEGTLVRGLDHDNTECLFVLSGESFTIEDFAEAVASQLKAEVTVPKEYTTSEIEDYVVDYRENKNEG